ncbi:MAG: TIGR04086 family membrane protein [Lachnospiraceae bacterium]|nr:TIGR04086 family membrane protein [Lachnospiraceae bacterium]
MEKKLRKKTIKGQGESRPNISVLSILKILLAMYMVTGILLLILSAMLYKMQLSESMVSAGIVLIYVISGFLGGFLSGKTMKKKRFLWGTGMGACYFLILVLGSIAFQRGINMELSRFFTTLILCTASGMIGGMAS